MKLIPITRVNSHLKQTVNPDHIVRTFQEDTLKDGTPIVNLVMSNGEVLRVTNIDTMNAATL